MCYLYLSTHTPLPLSLSLNSQCKIKILCRSLIFTSTDNGHQQLAEIRPGRLAMPHKSLEPHAPWGRWGGGRGGHKPAAAARVCLRPEAGRTHTESIFLMPSISFMRMDYAAGIIYTSGDDKF